MLNECSQADALIPVDLGRRSRWAPDPDGRIGVPGVGRSSVDAMRSAVLRLWRFCQTPEGLKVIRYTLVSVISALTSLVLLTIVYGVLRLWTEVISTLFANVMAGIPSYVLNRRWVWGKSGRSHIWREILPFWVMSFTGIGFALYTASLAHNFADAHHLHHLARTVLVVGANVAAFGILWILKFLILNRLFAEIADAEVGAET
jgi:putative flippase GtrA